MQTHGRGLGKQAWDSESWQHACLSWLLWSWGMASLRAVMERTGLGHGLAGQPVCSFVNERPGHRGQAALCHVLHPEGTFLVTGKVAVREG